MMNVVGKKVRTLCIWIFLTIVTIIILYMYNDGALFKQNYTKSNRKDNQGLDYIDPKLSYLTYGDPKLEVNYTLSFTFTRCPDNPSDDLLYLALTYLLRDLSQSERLIREPDMKGERGIRFLENYRNPCWLEELPSKPFTYPQRNQLFSSLDSSNDPFQPYREAMTDILVKRQKTAVKHKGYGTRLRCVPYIFIIGMHKGGTSDLHAFLCKHPLIQKPVVKEPPFWGHLPSEHSLSAYLDLYDYQANKIYLTESNGFHPRVTIDSAHWLSFTRGSSRRNQWISESDDLCLSEPQLLHYFTPKSKYILMLREQIDWLLSCYNYFTFQSSRPAYPRMSSKAISERVQQEIKNINNCFSTTENKFMCVYRSNDIGPCHSRYLYYYLWVKHWFDAVGKDNILIINSNVYFKGRTGTLTRVYKFLDLPYTEEDISNPFVKDKRRAFNTGKYNIVSFDEDTRMILKETFQPWNEKLADILQDSTFKWK